MLKGIARTLGLGVGAIVLALASLPAGAAAGAGASVAPLRPSPSAAPVAARPNIVLIMTDDQNLDDLRWMPLTRRLIGAAGVRFENGISPNPLCCPARASLLTGQMSQNNGVWNNIGKHGGYQALNRGTTLPVWLRNAGYQTAFFGKHLNEYDPRLDGRDPGWTILDSTVTGIYDYRGFSTYNNGHIKLLPKAYITDYVRGATARAIERFDREDRKPFFIWASYVAPHRSTGKNCEPGVFCQALPIPAERHRNRYPDALPGSLTKPSFNEDDMSDKPPYMQLFPKLERRLVVREHRARIRALASVDEAVAGTLRTLKRHGELDRTLVVFTSDNGFVMGEHRYVGKVLPYQESVRVPLLVRGPGVARGAVSSQLATTFDLTKTFTDLAGARPGRRLDGVSLTPYLQDPGQTDRRPHTLIQSGGIGWGFDIDGWTYRGYRDPRYTFARYAGGFMELYDRDVDPYELNNLASEPGYTLLRRELLARTRTLSSCAGATCRQGFDPVPTPGGRRLAAQNRLRGGRPALD